MNGLRFVLACLLGAFAFTPQIASGGGEFAAHPEELTVAENAGPGSLVGDVDPDAGARVRRYSIVEGNDADAFAIDGDTGRLTVNNSAALNHEHRQQFDLILEVESTATDDPARRAFLGDVIESGASLESVEKLLTDNEQFRVTVLVEDVAEPPVLPMQTATVVVSDSRSIEDVRIGAYDEDGDDQLQFQILAGAPSGLFDIDASSGRIRVDPAAELVPGDHEFPLTVQVTDSDGHSDATTISVRVIARASEPEMLASDTPDPIPTDPPEFDTPRASVDSVISPDGETAESVAVSRPDVLDADNPGIEEPVEAVAQPVSDGQANPAEESIGSRLLRIAGVFLLLGVVVATVMAWLRWRSRGELSELEEDRERLQRLQFIDEEPIAPSAAEVELETPTEIVPLEDSVLKQLCELQQTLALDPEKARITNETTHPGESGDIVDAPGEGGDESHLDAVAHHESLPDGALPLPLLPSERSSKSVPALPEYQQVEEQSAVVNAMDGEHDGTLDRWDTSESSEINDAAADPPTFDGVEDQIPAVESVPLEHIGMRLDSTADPVSAFSEEQQSEPDLAQLRSDPMPDHAGTESVTEPEVEVVDQRVCELRSELAEKFGISIDDLKADSERLPELDSEPTLSLEESVSIDDSGLQNSRVDSELILPTPGDTVEPREGELPSLAEDEHYEFDPPIDSSQDESSALSQIATLLETPASASESKKDESPTSESAGLMTSRFLTQEPDEPPPGATEGREHAAGDAELQVTVSRPNKSAIRRELASLREVANLHARAAVAKHATQTKTRQTWSRSAAAMVLLNFAAMGLLASSSGGIQRTLGWGLLIAGAGALAVCLHSFRQMVANNETDNQSDSDDEHTPVTEPQGQVMVDGIDGQIGHVSTPVANADAQSGSQNPDVPAEHETAPQPPDDVIAVVPHE